MKKTKKTVTIYEVRDGFTVEVTIQDKGFYDFYLTHDEYGCKMFMFGTSCRANDIEALVESNVDNYIDFYLDEFF